jgi:hypothetical protein
MPGARADKRPRCRRRRPRCTTLRDIATPSEDDLYALPLDEFTPARNELEKQLRGDGERERAKAVKALRKPTASAWALNQVARRRGKDVERLVAAGERLRAAQEQLLEGGDRDELTEAAAEERELVGELAAAAAAIAGEAGIATGAALDDKLRATLHAAATDEETARELAAGRLTREREAVGLFGMVEAPTRAPQTKPKGKATRSKGKEAGEEEAKAQQQRVRELERELKAATSVEKKAQRSLQAASRGAATALERAEAAAQRLKAAEEEQHEAEAALEEASGEVRRLEEELSRVRP